MEGGKLSSKIAAFFAGQALGGVFNPNPCASFGVRASINAASANAGEVLSEAMIEGNLHSYTEDPGGKVLTHVEITIGSVVLTKIGDIAEEALGNVHTCFVAGTPVLMGGLDFHTLETTASTGTTIDVYLLSSLAIFGVVIGVQSLIHNRKRREDNSLEFLEIQSVDRLFEGENDSANLWSNEVIESEPHELPVDTSPNDLQLRKTSSRSVLMVAESPELTQKTVSPNRLSPWLLSIPVIVLIFLAAWLSLGESPSQSHQNIATKVGDAPAKFAPIERICVGQRVITGSGDHSTSVDTTTWKKLRLQAQEIWPNGQLDVIEVSTLQPPLWIAAQGAVVGAEVELPLDLIEMGLPPNLRATVLEILPCPTIDPPPGRIVLSTVNHLNPSVVELTLRGARDGRKETIRPTRNHRFYSLDQNTWSAAGEIRPGERLQGLDQDLIAEFIQTVPGVHRVYNLTVEGDHVYHVSHLRAHNNNNCPGAFQKSKPPAQGLDIIPNRGASTGLPMSIDDAIDEVRKGGDVLAEGRDTARIIAEGAGDGPPVWDPPHGPRQKPHFHPTVGGERSGGHVLY